jgi:hypothetical protein
MNDYEIAIQFQALARDFSILQNAWTGVVVSLLYLIAIVGFTHWPRHRDTKLKVIST